LDFIGAFVPVALVKEDNHDKRCSCCTKSGELMFNAVIKISFIYWPIDNGSVPETHPIMRVELPPKWPLRGFNGGFIAAGAEKDCKGSEGCFWYLDSVPPMFIVLDIVETRRK